MTQNIDRPRHRRSDADELAGATAHGYGRPMSTGYGTPPAGYGAPQHAPQFAPSFQSFGAPQHAPQYGGPQHGAPQYHGAQPYGAPQFAPYPQNHATPHPSSPLPTQTPNPVPPQGPNGLATAGLVVAIIGAVLSFIPIVGTVAWGLAPIGLVLSVIGLVRSGRARNGRGKSVAGIVLSVVALIMCVIYTVSFTSAVASGVTATQAESTAVHTVTYKVTTAKGTRITASYSQSKNNDLAMASVSGAGSPWTANAQVSGFTGPNVTASLSPDVSHMNKSDTITCTIIEDGVQVAHDSATGPGAMVSCTK